MINIYKLKKEIPNQGVLSIDNMVFQKGNIYSIVGHNGSGKSTLIKIIYNIEKFKRGSITINDEYIDSSDKNDNIYKYMSYMPQENRFLSGSLRDNFNYLYKYSENSDLLGQECLENLLDEFELTTKLDTNVKKLSGGEMAKAQFVRSLIMNKEFNLFDEPMANMDFKTVKKTEEKLKQLKNQSKTVILVTHDFAQAKRVSDYIVLMENLNYIGTYETNSFFSNFMQGIY